MRRQFPRSLGLAALLAAVVLACAAPAGAANSASYTDPAGDNQGAGTANYAADIISLQVSSQDNGDMTVTITLESGPTQGVLFSGDFVQIGFDDDADPSTGEGGFEGAVRAYGQGTAAPPLGELCRLQPDTSQLACEPYPVTSTVSAPNHVLTFTFSQGNWFAIRIAAFTSYPRADGSCCNVDLAPDSGYYDYDVRADPDGDGVSGFADLCPNKKGGPFDRDADGCPGPYETLAPVKIRYAGFIRTSSFVSYRGFAVTAVPRQAVVKVRAGNRTFRRIGSGVISGLNNRPLAAGLRITITISRPGFCSSQRIIRIQPSAATGFVTLRESVLRPGGGIVCLA